jgi:ribosomal protein S27AE
MTYTCKVCDVTSDAAEFYKGTTNRCKECHKLRVKQNRESKADYYKEYDAKRFKEDPKVRARNRRYSKTEGGKASMRKAQNLWRKSNPDKRAAHTILRNAVRNGRTQKPENCSRCGAGGRIEGHHHDYTMPLDVTWLCRQCHVNEHKETF